MKTMKTKLVPKKDIRDSFINNKGIKMYEDLIYRAGFALATSPYFNIKLIVIDDKWLFQLGVKKNFDRWANSVNFIQEIPVKLYHPIIINFNDAIRQAKRIVNSNAFNWNCYYKPVYLNAGYRYLKESKYK